MNRKLSAGNLIKSSILVATLATSSLLKPNYDPTDYSKFLSPGFCSGYATRKSEKKFGKHFNKQHAWNLKYVNKTEPVSGSNLSDMLKNSSPGDILGIHLDSRYNLQPDMKDNPRTYSHVAIFDRKDFEGNFFIDHNINGPRIDNLKHFLKNYNAKVIEIIKGK